MFDAVLHKHRPQQGYLPGVVMALITYAALIAAAVLLFNRPEKEVSKPEVEITLFNALPPPPPPPPPPAGASTASSETPKVPKKPKIVEKVVEPKPVETPIEPTPVEPEPSPEPTPDEGASNEGGVVGGVAGGVPGGVLGGVQGGVVGGTVGSTGTGTVVLPFGPGMTRPEQIVGAPPVYSREALAARVEGKVLVRCTITVSGEVQDCHVIKGVPMLTEVVLASLQASRFTPVHYRGSPQAIQYLFTFNFKLP